MKTIQKPYKIIISGGGTGGHIYPAIAIAHALRELLVDVEILFVGAKGKMEMQKVPEAGYPIIGLWISGLQRKITFDNLAFPFKVVSSLVKSWFILKKFKPNAVVGVGGYASGPLLYTATFSGIPALIQEQNSYAGLTNKWLAKRVNTICVAYHKMDRFFPKDKLVFTGNPVRSDILDISEKRNAAVMKFDLDGSKKTLLVLGGSLGARTLNESLLIGLNQLVESGVQVIWQTGQFYFEEMKRRTADQNLEGIRIMPFIKEMDLAYAAADVVVSRAGALSISELCLVAKPVVFVPSTNVAEDHQTKNALAVVENMGALMVKDADAVQTLIPTLINLLEDAEQQLKLSTNISKLAMPHAAKMIAEEIKLLIA